MGAFGSCLGVGRPMRPDTNPKVWTPSLVDSNPFGPSSGSGRQMMRASPANSRQAYPPGLKGGPMPKLLRQSSSLSQGPQQSLSTYNPNGNLNGIGNNQTPSQTVPKLVDIDDNSMTSFDRPSQINNNSHSVCNRKSSSSQQANHHFDTGQSGSGDLENTMEHNTFLQSIKNPSEMRVLIGLYDYEERTQGCLAFCKGEHLETTVQAMKGGDWWLAKSKSTKRIGYVPSNYVAELKSVGAEPWYLGRIGRAEAEARLQAPENKDGAFIIRDSDTASHPYSLSLKHDNAMKHYKISRFEAGGYYISNKTVFSTIHDLVQHYSNAADGLCINLREPCIPTRFDKPSTVGLSYDTCEKWEIDRNKLQKLHMLGRGQFGEVFEGLFNGKTRVAIKTLRKGSMDPKDFLAEAQIMTKMKDPNLVQLYAVCTKEEPVYIVTELMSKGALINYLQTHEGKNLPLRGYISMATQIASGMSYIERENYVHRDLAARNILVGENNVCKIADFGLARFIKETEYEARAGARFPIKWTAPEAANFSKFTIKSDVWSYGIVLYEIITKGGIPYPDMTNAEVLSRIDTGYRMPQPPNCEAKYYSIMLECWNKDSMKRPTFATLLWRFQSYFESDEQYREAAQFRDR